MLFLNLDGDGFCAPAADVVKASLIASGGISDGRGMAAAIMLGVPKI
jgi:NAD(P)H-dependent flavin oxidoreductase YrpB (nitropropane dioxygenase family)